MTCGQQKFEEEKGENPAHIPFANKQRLSFDAIDDNRNFSIRLQINVLDHLKIHRTQN